MKTGGRIDASRLSRWHAQAAAVIARSDELRGESDAELLRRGRELRWQAKTQPRLADLLIETFALVREAARRHLGFQHFAVQIQGGIALFEGHVVTVNDYLAHRDAETMGPIYERLGLSVGCIQAPMQTEERRQAYAKDITYGTSKEIGFDFLRDRLRTGADASSGYRRRNGGGEAPVQRGHYFALIDEADSILIDEARTPLIIGLTQPNTAATVNLLRWSQRASTRLERDVEFVFEDRKST